MFTIKEEQMMRAIAEHKDFGKRNPVDIGIECGYLEKELLDMMEKICAGQETEEDNKKTGRTKYYFLIEGKFDGKHQAPWIVSVDIKNWEAKTVKKVENYDYRSGEFCIKDNYFVYQQKSSKILYWENLETGEKRKIFLDSHIQNFAFWNENIFILTNDELLLWDTDNIIKSFENDKHVRGDTIVTTEKKLYMVAISRIYEINTDLSSRVLWDGHDKAYGYEIGAVEYIDDELIWYMCKEKGHSCRKYRENMANDYSTECEGFYALRTVGSYGALNGIFTEHYRLLQKEIRSIDNKKKICNFPRKISNQGQVIAIPDKDIFIGVTSVEAEKILGGLCLHEDAIMKIDLREERSVEILPIKFESK